MIVPDLGTSDPAMRAIVAAVPAEQKVCETVNAADLVYVHAAPRKFVLWAEASPIRSTVKADDM